MKNRPTLVFSQQGGYTRTGSAGNGILSRSNKTLRTVRDFAQKMWPLTGQLTKGQGTQIYTGFAPD